MRWVRLSLWCTTLVLTKMIQHDIQMLLTYPNPMIASMWVSLMDDVALSYIKPF